MIPVVAFPEFLLSGDISLYTITAYIVSAIFLSRHIRWPITYEEFIAYVIFLISYTYSVVAFPDTTKIGSLSFLNITSIASVASVVEITYESCHFIETSMMSS
jgi:hypothetical protein